MTLYRDGQLLAYFGKNGLTYVGIFEKLSFLTQTTSFDKQYLKMPAINSSIRRKNKIVGISLKTPFCGHFSLFTFQLKFPDSI